MTYEPAPFCIPPVDPAAFLPGRLKDKVLLVTGATMIRQPMRPCSKWQVPAMLIATGSFSLEEGR